MANIKVGFQGLSFVCFCTRNFCFENCFAEKVKSLSEHPPLEAPQKNTDLIINLLPDGEEVADGIL